MGDAPPREAGEERLSHIAILRAARVRHKAIARGLQRYFDAVVAEPVPTEFLNLLTPAES
jgi:hypothetical protein